MSLKLKVLGLGLLAVMATSAFTVMNASATVSGHFTHDAATNHATITGTENGIHSAHSLSFQGTEPTNTFSGAAIVCQNASYTGSVAVKTTTSLTVTPSYSGCQTTNSSAVTVTTNGCTYTFHSNTAASSDSPTAHATVTVNCPTGKKIEIHHPSCIISVPPQSLRGATYKTTLENNKHAVTVNITITHIATQYHSGICIFLGTNHESDMTGSVTVKGFDTAGNQVNITAT